VALAPEIATPPVARPSIGDDLSQFYPPPILLRCGLILSSNLFRNLSEWPLPKKFPHQNSVNTSCLTSPNPSMIYALMQPCSLFCRGLYSHHCCKTLGNDSAGAPENGTPALCSWGPLPESRLDPEAGYHVWVFAVLLSPSFRMFLACIIQNNHIIEWCVTYEFERAPLNNRKFNNRKWFPTLNDWTLS
jgi:hypothetical protein